MKKIFSIIAIGCITAFAMTSCMNEHDDPNTDEVIKPTTGTQVTIGDLKDKYCASSNGADFSRNASNFFSKVNDNIAIEGVIVANDISGNLYQTLLLRHIDKEAGTDQCIQLAIKNTCLYPYFPIGQRIRVNLKGLYVGCYSKVPKIGQPYYTSNGNLSLGPMLFHLRNTHIEYIGEVDLKAPELVPVDLTDAEGDAWLRASANKTHKNVPMLATVRGKIKEVQGSAKDEPEKGDLSGDYEPLPKIFAPEALYDAGYAVDRTLMLQSNNSKVTVRTSTQNDIAFTEIPEDTRSYTGMLSYYNEWQVVLRSLEDISEN